MAEFYGVLAVTRRTAVHSCPSAALACRSFCRMMQTGQSFRESTTDVIVTVRPAASGPPAVQIRPDVSCAARDFCAPPGDSVPRLGQRTEAVGAAAGAGPQARERRPGPRVSRQPRLRHLGECGSGAPPSGPSPGPTSGAPPGPVPGPVRHMMSSWHPTWHRPAAAGLWARSWGKTGAGGRGADRDLSRLS